jgi:hypothetical protein
VGANYEAPDYIIVFRYQIIKWALVFDVFAGLNVGLIVDSLAFAK